MKLKISFIALLSFIVLILSDCKKKDKTPEETATPPNPLATLVTSAVTNITDTTAVSGGTVSAEGTSAITAVGICWDTLSNPTTLKSHTNNGAGTGSYASNIIGIKPNKKYYVRAYATNGNGTAYGNEISFLTPIYNLWSKSTSASLYSFNCLLSNGATIYAGTDNGIIFSSDTGNTWTSKGLSGSTINNMIITNNTLYAIASSGGLNRSTDNGATWTSLSNNFPYPVSVYDIAAYNNKLVAGTDSSAFISADGGNSWTRINNGLPSRVPMWWGGDVFKTVSSGTQVYAFASFFIGPGTEARFYKYDETNNVWNQKTGFSQQTTVNAKVSGNNVFIASNYSSYSSIGVSTDGGNTWSQISNVSGNDVNVCGATVFLSNTTTSSDFSLSTDNGTSWIPVKHFGLPSSIYGAFASTYYIWANTSNGIYKYKYH